MKKNLLIILSGIIYVAMITIVSLYIISPGISKINDANNIKELTYDEKTKLIDEINEKYITSEKEITQKYNPSIEEINKKYDNLESEIKEKYDEEEKN